MEDGAKHTLILYNCKVPQTGEVVFTAANAKCSANLKVKGELSTPNLYWFPGNGSFFFLFSGAAHQKYLKLSFTHEE